PAEDHHAYLEFRIRSDGWEWVERNNPASKYPTDFGLVSIQESERERLIGEIRKLGLVKDVNADLSYRRRDLLAKKRRNKGRAKVGAFIDGKKRPGKIFTAMSFSEAKGEPISNSLSFFPAMTKIMGMLGPKSRSMDAISGYLKAGMSDMRLFLDLFIFKFFEKHLVRSIGPSMFEVEALGLRAMYETGSIHEPKPFKVLDPYVWVVSTLSWNSLNSVLPEAIRRKLAEMHNAGQSEKGIGFDVNNSIGRYSILDF
ncbi:subtilisin-like protease SBT6.1 isoform X1, partial [Fagus crenata]